MKITLFTVLCALGLVIGANAQHGADCGTSYMVEQSLSRNPHLRQNQALLQDHTERFIEQKSVFHNPRLIIPVAVHIIHNFGPENISDAQVYDAIRILNEDFQKRGRDTNVISPFFKDRHTNMNVEFRLAKKDPNGKCTNGITRIPSTLTFSANDNVKDLVSWDTERYLNIWIVATISFGAGGYSYYPGTAPRPQDEGVVCLNRQFGSIGLSTGGNFSARTLTHEVGHYLNLAHTWGSTNSPGSQANCQSDDWVQDTPNTIGVTGQGCPLTMMSCGELANVENYMDYSSCGRMFTDGQGFRMHAALNSTIGGRNNLWTPSNLAFTGVDDTSATVCPPKGVIYSGIAEACIGQFVPIIGYFYNTNADSTLRYNWYIQGATPDTGSGSSMNVTFSQPGKYSARMIISNSAGVDTAYNFDFITITNNTPVIVPTAFESFEEQSFPNVNAIPERNWQISGNANTSYEHTNAAALDGDFSMRVTPWRNQTGTVTRLMSPYIDMSTVASPAVIRFSWAYACRNINNSDRLMIFVSTDCGQTFRAIGQRVANGSPGLITNGGTPVSTFFVPQRTEWGASQISLNRYIGGNPILIRFDLEAGGGNAFYLDDVRIGNQNLINSLSSVSDAKLSVRPMPITNESVLELPNSDYETVAVYNVIGAQLVYQSVSNFTDGSNLKLGELMKNLPSGSYVIKLSSGIKQQTLKVVK